MRDVTWQEIEIIFNEAVYVPSSERLTFLRARCGGNTHILGEVLQLLETDESAAQLFGTSAFNIAARLLKNEFNHEFLAKPFAHYRNLKLLSRGNPQAVLAAENTFMKRTEVLKILPSVNSVDLQTVSRFKREAEMGRAVLHPHIVEFYSFDFFEDYNYIAMEFVGRRSLRTILKKGGLKYKQVIRICRQIAEAIHALHSHGIVHGDVKPENILISSRGTAKIIDFGTSLVFDKVLYPGDYRASEIQDSDKLITGTPAYMSPEQHRGKRLTAHADLWSLAVVMHEMLSEERLFSGLNTEEIRYQVTNTSIRLNECLPLNWKVFLNKCLASDIDSRYDSAAAFIEACARV